ncbi:MAG TPA: c-type cytochrome [Terriglobales bacterium]|nr:c-type cytochrome [Terriglobales bacterium]
MKAIAAALAIVLLLTATGCEIPQLTGFVEPNLAKKRAQQMTGGNADNGRALIVKYGCSSCHTVPGVRGAQGKVGPPLTDFALRVYVAGKFPNNVTNVVNWIRTPQQMDPRTAMPNMGVTEQDAKDIAAYLYTLQ